MRRLLPEKMRALLPFLRRSQDVLVFGFTADESLRCMSTRPPGDRCLLVFESGQTDRCLLFSPGYGTQAETADRLQCIVDRLRRIPPPVNGHTVAGDGGP